jgi:nicotinamidase-related amidase
MACNSKLQLSNDKEIIAFTLTDCWVRGTIDNTEKKVTLSVPRDVDISRMTPEISVSPGATIYPPSNIITNFTLPQVYTVTAEDGSTQDYEATVTVDSVECLLVVDVQNTIFTVGIYHPKELLANIRTLLDLAHDADRQVIYIMQTDDTFFIENTDGWQIHIEVTPTEEDLIIQKHEPNSFTNTNLHSILHGNHIGVVYVVGLISNGCVEATCRGGNSLGYKVMLVRDAHSTTYLNPESIIEQTNINLQNEGVAELIYTDEVLFE